MHQLLIIDDQTILADDLADMLPWQNVGIETVHKAYSAGEALELMKTHAIDVIVTDIRMPGMNGLELIGEIRKSWSYVKCILLSGYADFEYAKQAILLKSNDYLLKPAADEELLEAVGNAVRDLEREWHEISSMQRAMHSLREQLPKLREYLLLDLTAGKQPLHPSELGKKLDMYEVPFHMDDRVHMMLVRMDHREGMSDPGSEPLIDYALTNMAGEIFGDRFDLWFCKDIHGFFVFLLRSKSAADSSAEDEDWDRESLMEQRAFQLQQFVKKYLKTGISVLISKAGNFPADISPLYQASVSNFRHFIGNDPELFVSLVHEPVKGQPPQLNELYRPPSVAQLLEIGQWDSAENKLNAILRELEEHWRESPEHVMEAFFILAGSLVSLIHKNKLWLSDTIGNEFYAAANGKPISSVKELRSWTRRVMDSYKNKSSHESRDSRSTIIRQVQEYIGRHVEDASLQSISASVFLNPSYLSKIYKMETGEGISDFLFRVRMEKAAALLSQSNEKIYEISLMLGYQKTSYFIQLFKKHYGLTPQEYRNKLI